jgi:formylmethanofuran dehydrogenase subunit E
MGFPDNRIDQSAYALGKGLTNKTTCPKCRKIYYGIFFMNANNQFVCGPCAGRKAEGLTSGGYKDRGQARADG